MLCSASTPRRPEIVVPRQRHSSRRQPLDESFLTPRLEGAHSYDRIAGYFSSSILEVAGEALERMEGTVRVVCNSQLSRADVEVAKAAQMAMRREWCDSRPETLGVEAKPRFRRLHDLLRSGRVGIRVLPRMGEAAEQSPSRVALIERVPQPFHAATCS